MQILTHRNCFVIGLNDNEPNIDITVAKKRVEELNDPVIDLPFEASHWLANITTITIGEVVIELISLADNFLAERYALPVGMNHNSYSVIDEGKPKQEGKIFLINRSPSKQAISYFGDFEKETRANIAVALQFYFSSGTFDRHPEINIFKDMILNGVFTDKDKSKPRPSRIAVYNAFTCELFEANNIVYVDGTFPSFDEVGTKQSFCTFKTT